MFQLKTAEFVFGDDKAIGMKFSNSSGGDLSSATGKVTLVKIEDDSVIFNNEDLAGSGTNPVTFSKLLTTGAGQNIEDATTQDYHATYTITYSGQEYNFGQVIRVLAKPVITIYHRIAEWTRSRLQKTAAELSDWELNADIVSILDWLMSVYPCIGIYPDDYTEDSSDRRAIEEAVGLLVAARRYPLQTTFGTGDVKARTEGDTRYEFDIGTKTLTSQGERDSWTMEATRAILRHSCIKDLSESNDIGLFSIVTPSRESRVSLQQVYAEMLSILGN